MTMTTQPVPKPVRRYTAAQVLERADARTWELVDGRLEKLAMGCESSSIGAEIIRLLGNYNRAKKLGHLFGSDASFQCFLDDPEKLRRADVAFIRRGRLPGEKRPKGQALICPDLIVEVISPNDRADRLEQKILDYLAAGARLIWIVYPGTRRVRIVRAAGKPILPSELTEDDTITGEDVLPGFSCKVSEFFAEE